VKWLLDTNVVSEGIRPRPDAAVLAWTSQQAESEVAISIVTLAELRQGISQTEQNDRRRTLAEWIESEVSRSFEKQTLFLTIDVLTDWLSLARRLGALGRPQSAPDLLIAATARVHSLILVTRNLRHFVNTGLVLYDPWTGETHKMERP
jgi:toxin FitB